MSRFLLTLAHIVFALGLLFGSFVASARAQEETTPTVETVPDVFHVPMRYAPPRISRPLVRLRINGAEAENFVLDTGCGVPLLLTTSYAKRCGFKPLKATVRINETIDLAAVEIKAVELEGEDNSANLAYIHQALVTDMPLEAFAPSEQIAGVIGIALFADSPVTMDFKAQTLTFHLSAKKYVAPAVKPVPLLLEDRISKIRLQFSPSAGTNVIIDTGAYESSIEQEYIDKFGTSHAATHLEWQVEGLYLLEAGSVKSLHFGDAAASAIPFTGIPAVLRRKGNTPRIGLAVLDNFRLTFDLAHHLLYFEVNVDPKLNRAAGIPGAALIADGNKVRVRRVEVGSPADLAGLKVGDEITSIDDVLVSGTLLTAAENLLTGLVGDEARIVVRRKTLESIRFVRSGTFNSTTVFLPCFQGVAGRILLGKPMEVHSLQPTSLLFRAGVRPGDEITRINGKALQEQRNDEIITELLRAPAVILTVHRKTGKTWTVKVGSLGVAGHSK